MFAVGLSLVGIAALIHCYIFYLESLAWTSPRTRATFGTTEAEARATKAMAFNQGFYNLFLAIVTAAGILAFALGHRGVGTALILAGAGSMVAAATVLFLSSRGNRGSALKQGLIPLLGLLCLAIGFAA